MVQSTVQFSHSPKPDDQFFQLTIVFKSPRASHAPSLASFLLFQLYFPSFCWAHLWFFLQEYHAIFSFCTRMYCCMTVLHLNMFLLSPSVPGSTRLRFIRYATTRLMPVNQWDHFLLSSRLFHPCPLTIISPPASQSSLAFLPVTSMDKASPLGDGQLRHKAGAAFGSPTVTVVKMTPLSFIPGAKITKYLGIINMFFIRETTSLREVRQ